MIGDGLHYEEPWISREYKKLKKILIPETEEYKRKLRQIKNENVNKQIKEKLKTDRCKCGGQLKQYRSGSKKVRYIDTKCNKTYTYKYKTK